MDIYDGWQDFETRAWDWSRFAHIDRIVQLGPEGHQRHAALKPGTYLVLTVTSEDEDRPRHQFYAIDGEVETVLAWIDRVRARAALLNKSELSAPFLTARREAALRNAGLDDVTVQSVVADLFEANGLADPPLSEA